MATTTLPLDYDLTIYSGATFRREFRWLPDGTTAQDFTGWHATMRIGTIVATIKLLTSAGGGVVLTSDGRVLIMMLPSDSAVLKPGVYAYNLDLIDVDGIVTRFLRGQVKIIKDVGV